MYEFPRDRDGFLTSDWLAILLSTKMFWRKESGEEEWGGGRILTECMSFASPLPSCRTISRLDLLGVLSYKVSVLFVSSNPIFFSPSSDYHLLVHARPFSIGGMKLIHNGSVHNVIESWKKGIRWDEGRCSYIEWIEGRRNRIGKKGRDREKDEAR